VIVSEWITVQFEPGAPVRVAAADLPGGTAGLVIWHALDQVVCMQFESRAAVRDFMIACRDAVAEAAAAEAAAGS
jgi:hypothetical protein